MRETLHGLTDFRCLRKRCKMTSPRLASAIFIVTLVLLCGGAVDCSSLHAQASRFDAQVQRTRQRLQQEYTQLRLAFMRDVQQLLAECAAAQLDELASEIRKHPIVVGGADLQGTPLPTQEQPGVDRQLPLMERRIRLGFDKLCSDHAGEIYTLSRTALHAELMSDALRFVKIVAVADSDHAMARKILGFTRMGNEWVTPFVAEMARKRQVKHPKFGWLPRTHLDKYNAGERFYRRWMVAEKENEIRRDFNNAWEVRTEHFLVRTNYSLERGVEIANRLEEYHDFLTNTLVGFFQSKEQLQKLFSSASSVRRAAKKPPHVVHYYRTRDEYIAKLQPRVPGIGVSTGYYDHGERISHFYNTEEAADDTTLIHEATHQIMYESTPKQRHISPRSDFWVTEGIACYMESYKVSNDGQQSVGDPGYIRFQAARYRRLVEDYYLPFMQFASMGQVPFQSHAEIARNYSQAAGVTHFLMHANNGQYRDALVEHLSQLYSANDSIRGNAATLLELTGMSAAEFDQSYADYCKRVEADLARQKTATGP